MLKIAVYDGGMGGALFADYLREELPIAKIIPVIDRQNREKLIHHRLEARATAERALQPYMGCVDLIVLANHFLTATSLKHFERTYPGQKFVGFALPTPDTFVKRKTFVLTTSALARRLSFRYYVHTLRRDTTVLALDNLPAKIDQGRLGTEQLRKNIVQHTSAKPKEIILACSHFNDLKPALREIYGQNLKFHDSSPATYREILRILKIRSYTKKK